MRAKARRLAQLEPLAEAYHQRQRVEDREAKSALHTLARFHAMQVGVILLHGEPKLKERLEVAWERCLIKFPDLRGIVEKVEVFDAIEGLSQYLTSCRARPNGKKFSMC